MLHFFEEAIRGGLSFVCNRYTDIRNSNREMLHIDMNNLYGGAQAEYLPCSNYNWHKNPASFMDMEIWDKMTPNVKKCKFYKLYHNINF